MSNGTGRDLARQAANVGAAVFQALAGVFFVFNRSSEPVDGGSGATLIDPAGYAFFVWAPILLLSLALRGLPGAALQARDALLRRVGWPLAGAFFLNGVWEVASPLGRLGAAQVLIAGILVCLAVAYLRLARSGAGRGAVGGAGRWLVAPTIGIYFGWITAANAVSLTSLAARAGLVSGGGFGGALFGAVLLLVGGVVAALVVRVGKAGVAQGYLAYGATFLWALAGIVAQQYQASVFTTTVAVVCAALVLWALFGATGAARLAPPPPRADLLVATPLLSLVGVSDFLELRTREVRRTRRTQSSSHIRTGRLPQGFVVLV